MWTSDLHSKLAKFAASAEEDLAVFAPYVTLGALQTVLDQVAVKNPSVITTWSAQDVLEGYSDVRIYPYLKRRGGFLFLLRRLHFKALYADFSRAVISTANITGRGLGISDNANIEVAVEIESLESTEHLWFSRQIANAMLVQDDYYEPFCNHVESQRRNYRPSEVAEFFIQEYAPSNQMLVSSLPMTDSPNDLLDAISSLADGSGAALGPLRRACVLHDCALYGLRMADNREKNLENLRAGFLGHPFVRAFRVFVNEVGQRYFGETKAWVQSTCADVPVPSRRDLSHHVRVLFDWMEDLSEGEYVVKRPHYSECLVHVVSNA